MEFAEYPLYGFSDGRITIISRGRNRQDVWDYIKDSFPRGVAVWELDALPLNAAEVYSRNHAAGWQNRMPEYLRRVL